MCVYVGGVVDVVECGLFFESRCVWVDCQICDAWSCKCWCIGSTLVSSCRCCVLVSFVHPVAILRAVFCTICSLSRMHWVTIW